MHRLLMFHQVILLVPGRAGDALYLSDISGKVIVVQQVLADGLHTMHMDGISSGMYFLTVKNPADGDTQTLRLIKQ
jgi:hypothetical protein